MKILVIEDEPKTAAYLRKDLTESGLSWTSQRTAQMGYSWRPPTATTSSASM